MCAADVLTEFPFEGRLSVDGTLTTSTGGRLGARTPGPVLPTAPPARDKPLFVDAATDPVKAALADGIARCSPRSRTSTTRGVTAMG